MSDPRPFPIIQLDYRTKIPLFRQIETQIRTWIEQGLLQPGDPLPTVRVLAGKLDVNFNTIARAYRLLDADNLITTWQGRGTVVAERKSASYPPQEMSQPDPLISLLMDSLRQVRQAGYTEQDILRLLHRVAQEAAHTHTEQEFVGRDIIARKRNVPKKKTYRRSMSKDRLSDSEIVVTKNQTSLIDQSHSLIRRNHTVRSIKISHRKE